ncbi:hypothetical protein GGH97_004390, partial [Coemansia sp. RSA 475]
MSQSDPRYTIKGASEAQQQAVDLLASQFLLTDERLGSITKEFRRRMEEGLASDGRVLKMIPS